MNIRIIFSEFLFPCSCRKMFPLVVSFLFFLPLFVNSQIPDSINEDTMPRKKPNVNKITDINKTQPSDPIPRGTSSSKLVSPYFEVELNNGDLSFEKIKFGNSDTLWYRKFSIAECLKLMHLPPNATLTDAKAIATSYMGTPTLYLRSDSLCFQIPLNAHDDSAKAYPLQPPKDSKFVQTTTVENGEFVRLVKGGIIINSGWFDFNDITAGFVASNKATLTPDKDKTPNVLELRDPDNPLLKDDQGKLKIRFDFSKTPKISAEIIGDD